MRGVPLQAFVPGAHAHLTDPVRNLHLHIFALQRATLAKLRNASRAVYQSAARPRSSCVTNTPCMLRLGGCLASLPLQSPIPISNPKVCSSLRLPSLSSPDPLHPLHAQVLPLSSNSGHVRPASPPRSLTLTLTLTVRTSNTPTQTRLFSRACACARLYSCVLSQCQLSMSMSKSTRAPPYLFGFREPKTGRTGFISLFHCFLSPPFFLSFFHSFIHSFNSSFPWSAARFCDIPIQYVACGISSKEQERYSAVGGSRIWPFPSLSPSKSQERPPPPRLPITPISQPSAVSSTPNHSPPRTTHSPLRITRRPLYGALQTIEVSLSGGASRSRFRFPSTSPSTSTSPTLWNPCLV